MAVMTRTTEHEWAIIDWRNGPRETGETFATAAEAWERCRGQYSYSPFQPVYLPPVLSYRTTSQFYR